MDNRQARTQISIANALSFLADHEDDLSREGVAVYRKLREIHDTIDTLARDQERKDRPGPQFRWHAHQFRENHLLPLSDLVRPHFEGEQDVLDALAVPHKRKVNEYHAAAERMLKVLTPRRAYLKQMGVDTRRITRLREELKQLKARERELYARSPASRLATPAMTDAFRRARAFLRAANRVVLESVDPSEHARWKSAIRVTKRLGRPRKKKPPRE